MQILWAHIFFIYETRCPEMTEKRSVVRKHSITRFLSARKLHLKILTLCQCSFWECSFSEDISSKRRIKIFFYHVSSTVWGPSILLGRNCFPSCTTYRWKRTILTMVHYSTIYRVIFRKFQETINQTTCLLFFFFLAVS